METTMNILLLMYCVKGLKQTLERCNWIAYAVVTTVYRNTVCNIISF